jgi:hypothetical protein
LGKIYKFYTISENSVFFKKVKYWMIIWHQHFQVSHRPPVSALHATDDGGNVELVWCQNPVPKFHGRQPDRNNKFWSSSVSLLLEQ